MKYAVRTIYRLGLVSMLTLPACDRHPEPAPPAPTTRVTIARPPASAPATQPMIRIPTTIVINNQPFSFPPAKLVLKKTAEGVRCTLFSDDPPEALKQDYAGNSFYFDFTIDADSIDALAGQQYVFRNSAGERSDSTTGIFIDGNRQVLQPLTAAIAFDHSANASTQPNSSTGPWVALIGGDFQLFDDQTPDAQAVTVKVRGRLSPHQVMTKP